MPVVIASLLSGMLTVLAPCTLSLLPIILGSSIEDNSKYNKKVLNVIIGLMVSIFVFTLLLKASTVLIMIENYIWVIISGLLLIFMGIITLFPDIWTQIEVRLKLSNISNENLEKSTTQKGIFKDFLIGAALGPVFSTCSPTFTIILASILPVNIFTGSIYLIVYCIGLGISLYLVSLGSKKILTYLKIIANPQGYFKRMFGVILVVLGIVILTGLDKKVETFLVEKDVFNLIQYEFDWNVNK